MTIEVLNHQPPYIITNDTLLTIVKLTEEGDDYSVVEMIDLSKIASVDWHHEYIVLDGLRMSVTRDILKAVRHWLFVQNESSKITFNNKPKLDNRQITTILAALSFFQRNWELGEDEDIDDFFYQHKPLGDEEIDELCEYLNTETI